ncbi:MAG: allantoinase AllB [Flavobacteriaceae bacterium]|nr:MAG: allantoinase AllB [Flavobacteriaceae bacterium]
MKNEFCIYSKSCFIEGDFIEATLHIQDDKIHAIHTGYKVIHGIENLNYEHFSVIPGIIDAHVHINEPGRTYWEGFDSATKAAALGGTTTLIEMPLNANPVTTTVEAFNEKKSAAENKLHVNCGFYGGVVPTNMADIEELMVSGVFGIKGFLTHSGIDEFPNVQSDHLKAIAPLLRQHNLPLLLHCELADSNTPEVKNEFSYQEYLHSRPDRWELNAIKLALEIQEQFNIKLHIVHLATAEGLPVINERKKNTNLVTVETCPHYLFFNAEDIPDASPIYKCAPPIRDKKNNDSLWNAMLNSEFDFLGSDHSPAPPEIKQLDSGNYFKAWGGIAGLQFLLSALYTSGKNRGLSLKVLLPLLTSKPAKFLNLDHKKGALKEGYDADIAILDTEASFTVTEEIIAHRHKASPYLGQELFGKVIHTFVNGKQVVKNSQINSLNQGQLLLKKRT